eukprot:5202551-Prymnesium_polylepis.1
MASADHQSSRAQDREDDTLAMLDASIEALAPHLKLPVRRRRRRIVAQLRAIGLFDVRQLQTALASDYLRGQLGECLEQVQVAPELLTAMAH